MSSETHLNISEAARATGRSIPTIRNYLETKRLPNAKAVKNGERKTWRIPLTDLVAAGLLDNVKPTTASASDSQALAEARELIAALRAENGQLRERLADAQQARADLIAAYAPRIETAQTQAERRRFWFSR